SRLSRPRGAVPKGAFAPGHPCQGRCPEQSARLDREGGGMSDPWSFTVASHLKAPAARVWEHASTFAGVNRELRPLVRMTHPRGVKALTPESFPLGRVAFRSWILLFGVVPVEYDDVTLVELEPGRGFREASRMMLVRQWGHSREVSPA